MINRFDSPNIFVHFSTLANFHFIIGNISTAKLVNITQKIKRVYDATNAAVVLGNDK